MRLLAAERVLRGLGLLVLAGLVLAFKGSQEVLHRSFAKDLPLLRPLADQIGWDINGSTVVNGVTEAFALSGTTLTWITVGLTAYAAVQFVEGTGLWLMKRWGEYFAVVATSIFLPWEIYEISRRVTALRVVLLLINIAAVAWLIWSKRLFGLRGGGAAFHAEHHAESLITIERAAVASAADERAG